MYDLDSENVTFLTNILCKSMCPFNGLIFNICDLMEIKYDWKYLSLLNY